MSVLGTTIREDNKYRRIKHAGYTQPIADRYGLLSLLPGQVKSVRCENEPEALEYRRWAIVNSGYYYRKTGRTTNRYWTRVVYGDESATVQYGIREAKV